MSIKELRTASGMSQSQFSSYFELSIDTLQNWEQGRRRCPIYLIKLIEYKLKKENLMK